MATMESILLQITLPNPLPRAAGGGKSEETGGNGREVPPVFYAIAI